MGRAANPLTDGRGAVSSSVVVNGEVVPTDVEGYCGYLNAHDHRAGRWVVIERNGKRTVDFGLGLRRGDAGQFTLIEGAGA